MWEDHSRQLDATGRVWPRAHLRAGDEDRRQVVAELQRHYVEGRLTADELGERVAQASAARTFGELAATLSDLPAVPEGNGHAGRGWRGGLILVLLPGMHLGLFPVWPLFIWGFFFIGRPGRGRRFH
jgi:hypothetical protein